MDSKALAATVLLAAGFALTLTSIFVPWGDVESDGTDFGDVGLFEITIDGGAMCASFGVPASDCVQTTEWTDEDLDDEDGIGQVRAGGPIFAVGVGLVGLATLLALWGMIGGGNFMDIGSGASLLATIALVLGTILFALGVQDYASDADIAWSTGLILAAIGQGLTFFGSAAAYGAKRWF